MAEHRSPLGALARKGRARDGGMRPHHPEVSWVLVPGDCIQRENLVAPGAIWCILPASRIATENFSLVGVGEGGARHLPAESHVIQLTAHRAQAGLDIA